MPDKEVTHQVKVVSPAKAVALRIHRKPDRWPWLDGKAETRFKKWEAQYQSYAFNWATCELVRKIGNPEVHPDVQLILNVHDEATKAESKLELA